MPGENMFQHVPTIQSPQKVWANGHQTDWQNGYKTIQKPQSWGCWNRWNKGSAISLITKLHSHLPWFISAPRSRRTWTIATISPFVYIARSSSIFRECGGRSPKCSLWQVTPYMNRYLPTMFDQIPSSICVGLLWKKLYSIFHIDQHLLSRHGRCFVCLLRRLRSGDVWIWRLRFQWMQFLWLRAEASEPAVCRVQCQSRC